MTRFAGVETIIKLNNDGSLTTGTIQDCTPILEMAKARHNEGQHGSSDMKLAASMPFVIVEKYCNDNGIEFSEFCNSEAHKKRLLSDPDLSYFRIWKGKM
jgi:hypothetical protein